MSTATDGRAREYKVRDHLISLGWEPIFRSAGSKGPADIGMATPLRGLALIQVGGAGKTLGPADRKRLHRAAWMCGAMPVLANVHKGRITYREVTLDKPSQWPDWEPTIFKETS